MCICWSECIILLCIYILVKAPLRVFYRTTRVYGAFTDFLVLRGRTDVLRFNPRSLLSPFSTGCFDRMDSQSDAEKQTDPVVSPSLLR